MGKTYTIKSEDKAAFINRLDKLGIAVDTYKITDNKMDGSFSIEFIDPNTINMINQMLKKSPKIDQVKAPKNVYTDKGMKSGGSELKEVENPIDVIKMDVPLFIRLLEYAREDAKTDMDLHDVTEKIIAAASKGQTLTMTDYDMIMSDKIQESFNPEDYEWEEEDDRKALGVLFHRNDDPDFWGDVEDTPYFWDHDAVEKLVKDLGYEDYKNIAGEFTHYTMPGDEDELRTMRAVIGIPDLQAEDMTVEMYKQAIRNDF
jgi:hypothetical protein